MTGDRIRLGALALCLLFTPAFAAAQQDAADVAWERKEHGVAERLYRERLERDSADVPALHRLGLLLAWAGQYDRSLELLDRMVRVAPGHVEGALDRARVYAWKGDLSRACEAADSVVARNPSDLLALRTRAQFASWAGDNKTALDLYARILAIAPNDLEVRRGYAQVLLWSGRHEKAADEFAVVLRERPDDIEARLNLARALAYSGHVEVARRVFAEVVRAEPQNADARRGLAQTLSWSGRLSGAEQEWRRILADSPQDVTALVGLAATLRWRGQYGEPGTLLERARSLAPSDRDVQSQLDWLHADQAPRIAPMVVHERDSEGNRMTTTRVELAWRLVPRVELRGEGFERALTGLGGEPGLKSRGGMLSGSALIGRSWIIGGGGGVVQSNMDGAEPSASFHAAVRSAPGGSLDFEVRYADGPIDATAAMVARGVTTSELSVSAGIPGTRPWGANARVAIGEFDGGEANQRLFGQVGVFHKLAPAWRISAGLTAFGFEREARDGYWSPTSYRLADVRLRWWRELEAWSGALELGPGVQQIGSDGDLGGVVQFHGRFDYRLRPGRQIGIFGGYSTSGLQRLSADSGGYRYGSFGLAIGWAL